MPRVLIAIVGCEKYHDRSQACLDTWASSNLCDIKVFTGPILDVSDDYDSLPAKTRAVCKWALDAGYDYLFKCDDDTYVWVDKLLESGFEDYDYIGFCQGKVLLSEEYASGGAGYWLSSRAMELVANADLTDDTCEDRWVGRVLYDNGIIINRDTRYAHGRHGESGLITLHRCSPQELKEIHGSTSSL